MTLTKRKILSWIAAGLAAVLLTLVCVDYFVLKDPLFDRSGWHTTDAGAVQYRDYFGRCFTGWHILEGKKYYFDADGSRHTGWLETDQGRYHLAEDGRLQIGWLELDGKRYYADESGLIATGWLTLDDSRYYMDPDGALHTGWLELPEGKYLLDGEGKICTGWTEVDGLRYYLREDGTLNENWQDTGDGLYYVVDGKNHTGWLDVPEGRYYFDAEGKGCTGWVADKAGRFYLYDDGTFATGFVEIDGVERYFLPTGEYVVLCNPWNPVPEDYVMNLVSYGEFEIDASCYDGLLKLMEAAEQEGISLKINSAYRSYETQQSVQENRIRAHMAEGMTRAQATAYVSRTVAKPGTSEHQTGLGIDINGSAKGYAWLEENGWKYGFIMRYPDNKIKVTGIIYEPWHFRYLGESMAKDVYESGLCLEEYFEMLKEK